MVTQKYVKSRKVYKLTFEVPASEVADHEVESLAVVGTFNQWDEKANLFKANKKGNYKAVVEVEEPGSYQYRYLLNGTAWLNDWHAEDYVTNESGTDNCLLTVGAA